MASVNNGIFICINCAAMHQAIGQEYTFVQSLTEDSWTEQEVLLMSMGGNKKLAAYFREQGLMDETADVRLRTEAAAKYRVELNDNVKAIDEDYVDKEEKQEDIDRRAIEAKYAE